MLFQYFFNPVYLEKKSIRKGLEKAASYAYGTAIDIGCGEKPYEDIFRPRVEKYIGLDVDTGNNKKVDIVADSLNLPFEAASVDTAISTQAIEHVTSPERFMREVGRVLKPGGVLILTAPQLWCLHEKPHDYYRFTRYALELLCRENGLTPVLLEERYGAFATIGQMFSLMIYLPNVDRPIARQLVRPLFAAVQIFFHILDRLFYNPDLTLGYLLVARKEAGAGTAGRAS